MEVTEILVEKREIEEELVALKQAMKEGYISKRSVLARDLMAVYRHFKYGGKLIDLYETFRATGIDKDTHPKIAIVQFGAKFCHLHKKRNGGAIFSNAPLPWTTSANKSNGDIVIPADTFEWNVKTIKGEHKWKCVAPIVPPRVVLIASAKLTPQHYHILFEPEEWTISKPAQPPGDPILGRMLTPNIFGVIATWDLTDLEKTIIKGRI